jgi:regulator of nucleoside diphosphate kinase
MLPLIACDSLATPSSTAGVFEMRYENDGNEKSAINPALIIAAGDYERLLSVAMGAKQRRPDLAGRLLEEIERADLRPSVEVPLDVVAIGSDVTFYENDSEHARTVRLVFPWDADVERGWISVLTPLGAGLLGLSIGQSISWEIGGRVTRLTIIGVNQSNGSAELT